MRPQIRNEKYLTNEMFVKGTGMYVQKQETWACEVSDKSLWQSNRYGKQTRE